MRIVAIIALCFIPLIAYFICFALLSDEFKIGTAFLSILMGLLAVIPIAAAQFALEYFNLLSARTLIGLLVQAIVLNGLIEELLKAVVLLPVNAKKIKLSTFVFYSMLCGLSVGCFETVIYLISGYMNIGLRMITAVLIHTFCTGLGGIFIYSIKIKKTRIWPIILAVLLHGIFNYFSYFSSPLRFFCIAVVLFAMWEVGLQYKNTLPEEESFDN